MEYAFNLLMDRKGNGVRLNRQVGKARMKKKPFDNKEYQF